MINPNRMRLDISRYNLLLNCHHRLIDHDYIRYISVDVVIFNTRTRKCRITVWVFLVFYLGREDVLGSPDARSGFDFVLLMHCEWW